MARRSGRKLAQTGTFQLTDAMNTARALHTATALANGKVLIAGGYDQTLATLALAEIYDPIIGRFSPTDTMGYGRVAAAATPLKDGRVLMVGGQDASGIAMASVEIYDPITGTFTDTGSMLTARLNPTVTLLSDGRVLVAGGYEGTSHGQPLMSAEVYQPSTGTFVATGSMTTARRNHIATLLNDGNVLVVGGYNGTAVNAPELYNSREGTFMPADSMSTPRRYPSATLMNDGGVLVAGGYERADGGALVSTEIYRPQGQGSSAPGGSFVASGPMQGARGRHTATDLGNGRILITGGYDGQVPLASAELYTIARGTTTATPSMTTARWRHTETLLPDGRVLIAGGADATAALASAELFTPHDRAPLSMGLFTVQG